MSYRITRWGWGVEPREEELRAQLRSEGLAPYVWRNGPGYEYSAHTHSYIKVLCVIKGSITFYLPETEESLLLEAGDRLELPARTLHAATTGPEGVVCMEAIKRT